MHWISRYHDSDDRDFCVLRMPKKKNVAEKFLRAPPSPPWLLKRSISKRRWCFIVSLVSSKRMTCSPAMYSDGGININIVFYVVLHVVLQRGLSSNRYAPPGATTTNLRACEIFTNTLVVTVTTNSNGRLEIPRSLLFYAYRIAARNSNYKSSNFSVSLLNS